VGKVCRIISIKTKRPPQSRGFPGANRGGLLAAKACAVLLGNPTGIRKRSLETPSDQIICHKSTVDRTSAPKRPENEGNIIAFVDTFFCEKRVVALEEQTPRRASIAADTILALLDSDPDQGLAMLRVSSTLTEAIVRSYLEDEATRSKLRHHFLCSHAGQNQAPGSARAVRRLQFAVLRSNEL
jgi:hypothetical protein